MTSKERKIFVENFNARKNSRITHLSSGYLDQFPAMAGQSLTAAVDLPNDWEPDENARSWVPGQSGTDPDTDSGVDTPESVTKDGDDDTPQRAKVNRDGQTEPPHHVSDNNTAQPYSLDKSRNVMELQAARKAVGISREDFDKLSPTNRGILYAFQKMHPNVIIIK